MNVQTKLLAGVTSLTMLAILCGALGLWQVKTIEVQINEISDVVTPTIETADDVIYYATDMQKLVVEMLADEEIEDVNVLFGEFQAAETKFNAAVNELATVVVSTEMKDRVAALVDERTALSKTARDMYKAHILELENEIESESQQARMDAQGDQLAEQLLALSESNEAEMAAAENRGDDLAASGSATVGQMNELLGELFERDYPMVEAALKLRSIVNGLEAAVAEVMAEEDASKVDGLEDAYLKIAKTAEPHFESLEKNVESDQDRTIVAELKSSFADWVALASGDGKMFDIHRSTLKNEVLADQLAEKVDEIGDNLVNQINVIGDAADVLADGADEKAAELVNTATLLLLGIGLLTLGLASGLIAIILRTVIRPLNDITTIVGELAGGNLSVEVPHGGRQDEIGKIASAVAVFRQSGLERERLEAEAAEANEKQNRRQNTIEGLINDFRGTMHNVLEEVLSDSENMKQSAVQLNTISEETESIAGSAATASSETNANVQTVASATEELSSSIQEIGVQVASGAKQTADATASAKDVDGKVTSLSEAAHQIGQVVELISDIAEQTNLLALNATIEAARAGESGKGFAVVASEVKSLAQQTANATEEISKQITAIQSSTNDAVVGIGGIATSMGDISEFMTSMATAVEEQTAATADIARNIQGAADGTMAMSDNIDKVNSAVAETKSSAHTVLSSSEDLSRKSVDMRREVETFLAAVEAA